MLPVRAIFPRNSGTESLVESRVMTTPRSRRRGFTLVELLVVITIIGMLMALLMPAVNAAVESGRNAQCKNNVRQLLIALDIYENRKKRYPGYENEIAGTGTAKVNWLITILPEIEQLDVYDEWLADPGNATAPTNTEVFIELLSCPSDPPEQVGGAINSYVGNSGFGADTYANAQKTVANGVMHTTGIKASSDTMPDGKSNTCLVSENIQATTWSEVTDSATMRNATTFVWHTADPPASDTTINGAKTTATEGTAPRPSSFHSGGVNMGFCDTHVIFLREDIDYKVYAQIMTPHGDSSDMVPAWKVPFNAADLQ